MANKDSTTNFKHQVNGIAIEQRSKDGFINATAMCVAHHKDASDWLKTDPTLNLVEALAQRLGVEKKKDVKLKSIKTRVSAYYPTLVVTKSGSPENGGGTWIHSGLSKDFESWLRQSKKESLENIVRNKLWEQLGGIREVIVQTGKIDLLTETELIEVKNFSSWKSAIGQVLVYGDHFPTHQKRIHLFNVVNYTQLRIAESYCTKFGIKLTWEDEVITQKQ